jgi:hypothetical protein
MAVKRIAMAALIATMIGAPARAQQPSDYGAFAPFFSDASPECVQVAAIEKAAARTQALRTETFRFVGAIYFLAPPMSAHLPPGDHAEIVTDRSGISAVVIIDGVQTCARLALPANVLAIVLSVDRGEVAHVGEGT